MPITLTCQQCGTEFSVRPSRRNRKYCSRECSTKAQTARVTLICQQCGNEYSKPPAKAIESKYCSNDCASKAKRKRILLICQQCGKTFETYPSVSHQKKYCSKACHNKAMMKRITKVCPQCNKEFTIRASKSYRKYCSHSCALKSNASTLAKAKQTSRYREIKSKQTKKLWQTPEYRKKVLRIVKSPAVRLKISKAMKTLWNDPNFANKVFDGRSHSPTRPEALISQLTPPNVRYVGDFSFWRRLPNGKYTNPDFIAEPIKKTRKVIYFHGTYWHRDEQHNNGQYLIDQWRRLGYDCLILWDDDIEDLDVACSKIAQFLGDTEWQLSLF